MNQHGYVSFWAGTSPSSDGLTKYVRISHDSEGAIVPSNFMVDFNLEPWDEGFREAAHFTDRRDNLSSLLEGFSFDEEIIPQFERQVGLSLSFPVNSVILLYDYHYQGASMTSNSQGVSMRFLGVAQYPARHANIH